MRALVRLGWLLSAIAIPACVGLLALGVQAVAFSRPSRDAVLGTQALRELLRFREMRAVEHFGGRDLHSTCIHGWYHVPHRRRITPVSLVLLSNGERLYDYGNGVRKLGLRGRAGRADFERFLLAGCPRVIAGRLGGRLVNGRWIDADMQHAQLVLKFGNRAKPMEFIVSAKTDRPLALRLVRWPIEGASRLDPGGGGAAVWLVRHAFHLKPMSRHRSRA